MNNTVEATEKTKGERLVRTSFNPSQDGVIDQIKQKSAELINLVDGLSTQKPGVGEELGRLKALAITSYEEAAMWAVKAATV